MNSIMRSKHIISLIAVLLIISIGTNIYLYVDRNSNNDKEETLNSEKKVSDELSKNERENVATQEVKENTKLNKESRESNKNTPSESPEELINYKDPFIGIQFDYPSNFSLSIEDNMGDLTNKAEEAPYYQITLKNKDKSNQSLTINFGRFFDGPLPTSEFLTSEIYKEYEYIRTYDGKEIVKKSNPGNLPIAGYSIGYFELIKYDSITQGHNPNNTAKDDYFLRYFPIEFAVDSDKFGSVPLTQIQVLVNEKNSDGRTIPPTDDLNQEVFDKIVQTIRVNDSF